MFEISRKKNDLLFMFNRSIADFPMWRDRVIDHCCRSTLRWRNILEYIQVLKHPIPRSWLMQSNLDGINGWDVATLLEAFLVDWFPKDMYRRRIPLAGGEQGNGFEMWRLLYQEYQGGTEAVEFGGVRRLQEFSRCTDIKKLNDHIDDWLDVLSNFGAELEQCPRMLKSMVLNIIPKAYEDELLTKPEHCFSYHAIIAWCRQKTSSAQGVVRRHPPTCRFSRTCKRSSWHGGARS